MTQFVVQESASYRIDEIYQYTLNKWGKKKANSYIEGLFKTFSKIRSSEMSSRPIPAEFGVNGFYFRYEKHFVYWKYLGSDEIGIVIVLHERMHQIRHFK